MQLTFGEIAFFFFLTAVTGCGISDLVSRRIPHPVTVTLIGSGFIYHAVFNGRELTLTVLASAAAVFIMAYLVWKAGQMGGGDVFLLTALAVWLGWKMTLVVVFWACLIGLPFGIVNLVRAGELRWRISALVYGLHMKLSGVKADGMIKRLPGPEEVDAPVPAGSVPFGTFLALGLWVVLYMYAKEVIN